jgi:molybdate transport repressor ModE-like protein
VSLDPRRLLVLHAVRSCGSVQAAAERLHLTPSAVSQHLAKLEAETGLALVDRSRLGGGRSVGLTAAGQALAQQAERLAEALADAEATLTALRGAPGGPVVIGAFPTAIRRLVAPAVAQLAADHPALSPKVVEANEPAALQDLAAGRLDLAILDREGDAGERSHPGIHERPLLRDEYRVVTPAGWAARTDLDVLTGPWIAAPAGSAARAALDRLVARAGGAAPAVAHECLEFPAAMALVGSGLGAAIVPELALDQFPQDGVRVHRGALDAGARVLTVAHRTGRSEPTAAVDVVLRELLRHAGQETA